jgi:hypothetical protein
MSEANGTSTEVGERVATAIFKAKGCLIGLRRSQRNEQNCNGRVYA